MVRFWLACSILLLLTAVQAQEVAPQRLVLLRGVIAYARGDMAAAETNLREASRLNTEDWRVQILYGQALAAAGKKEWAKSQFRRAVLLTPTRLEPWQAMAQAGRDLNDRSLEITALSGSLRLMPENPLLLQRLADAYGALGQVDSAARMAASWQAMLPPLRLEARYASNGRTLSLDELRVQAKPETRVQGLFAALAYEEWRAGNKDAARAALKSLYALNTRDVVTIANYVHVCLLTSHPEEALPVLQAAAPLGDYALDRTLALWSIAGGKYAEAIEPLQRLLLRNQLDSSLNRLLGVAALLGGNLDVALSALRLSWLKEPDHITAQAYATALLTAGRVVDAEELLKRAAVKFTDETMLKVLLAQLYRDTNRLVLSADTLAAVAKGRPESIELYQLAGERYMAAGYLPRAFTMACALRDAFPDDVVALHAAVELFRRQASYADARLVLTRYLGPAVDSPLQWEQIMLEVARYAIADNRPTEAIAALDEVLRRNYACRQAYEEMGRLYEQRGQWTEAMRLYAQAQLRWRDDVPFLMRTARTAREAGNYPLAAMCYQRVTTLVKSPEAWLEWAELDLLEGNEAHAKTCWDTAATFPDGAVRAERALLAYYDRRKDAPNAAAMLEALLTHLAAARAARLTEWKAALAAMRYTATDAELHALLLLEPTLVDPAPLEARRRNSEMHN
jgi:predicted Zn-dependent protease